MTLSPRTLFRTFAIAELFTWAGLITAIIVRATDAANFVPIAGGIHGFAFLCYATTTVFVWVNQKWSFRAGFTGLVLAIVPFATWPFDIWADKRGMLNGPWRLVPGGDEPRTFIEKVQALVLRRPIVSALTLLVVVAIIFTVLLMLGPPIPRS